MKQSTNRSTKQPINNAPTRTTNLPTNPPTKPTNGPTNGPAIRPKQPTNPFIHPLTQPIHPPINQSTNAIHKPTKPNQRTQPPSLQMRVQVTRQRDRRKQTNYSRGGLHHNNQPFNLPTNRPTNQPTNQSNQPPNQKPIQPTNQPSNQPIKPTNRPNRVFAENVFGWVGFLAVCFLYKINPNPRKIICCGKKWPECH